MVIRKNLGLSLFFVALVALGIDIEAKAGVLGLRLHAQNRKPAQAPVNLLSFTGNDSHLSHQSGYAQGNTWATDTKQPANSFLSYGPYTTQLGAGSYVARFLLAVDNNSADDLPIATIDVHDAAHNQVLASETLTRREFSAKTSQTHFDVPFTATAGASLEFRVYYHGSSYLQHLGTQVFAAEPAPQSLSTGKTAVLFSLDQGFGNGVVVQGDVTSTLAIIDAVNQLSSRYDVYLVVNPMVANKENLYKILDTLVAQKIGFVLDVYSSDSSSMGDGCATTGNFTNPAGPGKASSLSIPLSDLAYYKTRYRGYFAGLRIFEILAQDNYYNSAHSSNGHPCWMNDVPYQSQYAVFNKNYIQTIFNFAQSNNMFVEFSDQAGWSFSISGQSRSKTYESDIANALSSVGGASAPVYLTYANNANVANAIWNASTNQANWTQAASSDWYKWVPGLRSVSGLGNQTKLGLSDQSWICSTESTCPVGNIITWAWGAKNDGVGLLQFESVWYYFNLPSGSMSAYDYTTDPAYAPALRGQPNDNFKQLLSFLLSS